MRNLMAVITGGTKRDPVQDFHDSNAVLKKLDDTLSSARFGESRGGLVPPQALAQLREDIRDALATLDALA